MTAPAPLSSGDNAAEIPRRKSDVANTSVLLVVAFFFALGFSVMITLAYGYCVTDCNPVLMDIGYGAPSAAVWIVFAVTCVVSILLLRRGGRAWFVPLIGIATMIALYAVWSAAL